MKIIFLDIDGVLNTPKSSSRCENHIGIDGDKILRLKKIVDETNAKIVLISTWKENWEGLKSRKIYQDCFANYLDVKFQKYNLEVYDKTPNRYEGIFLGRGEGILAYLEDKKIESFVIIDDLQFDYDSCDLTDYFIQTNVNVGLTDENVQSAIAILKY